MVVAAAGFAPVVLRRRAGFHRCSRRRGGLAVAVSMAAAAAAMVVEGEKKIRVRVLGDEDDDVAESDWLIW